MSLTLLCLSVTPEQWQVHRTLAQPLPWALDDELATALVPGAVGCSPESEAEWVPELLEPEDLFAQALAQPRPKVTDALVWPIASNTTVTSSFGRRLDPVEARRRRKHRGVDIRARKGTPVLAAAEGLVTSVRRRGWGGLAVKIDHGDGVLTRYAHLHRSRVRVGQRVRAGQRIGLSGASGRVTGPHLHFELWKDGRAQDPLRFQWRHHTPWRCDPKVPWRRCPVPTG